MQRYGGHGRDASASSLVEPAFPCSPLELASCDPPTLGWIHYARPRREVPPPGIILALLMSASTRPLQGLGIGVHATRPSFALL